MMDFAPSPRIQIRSLETRGLLVELTGPLTALDRDLEDAIVGHLNAGRRDFILKMSGVTNMDNMGLGQLISVYKLIKASDGTMRISGGVNWKKRVRLHHAGWMSCSLPTPSACLLGLCSTSSRASG